MNDSKLILTIDIEDWYHIPPVCGSPSSIYKNVDEFYSKWNSRYDYLSEPTNRTLKLLNQLGIRATFFIVSSVYEHYPGLVESIVDEGHEIACHGLNHSTKIHPITKKPLMSKKEFLERTLKAKNMLERVCRERIIGYRAPNGYVGGWMLDLLEELKFKYDSSVSANSFYNKTDSSLNGVFSNPYYPIRGELVPGNSNRDLIEFPWPYYSIFGIRIPTAGGPLLRFFSEKVILNGLKQSLKRGDAVFYFHPIDISNEKFPDVWSGSSVFWAIKGDLVERRIRSIIRSLSNYKKSCLRDLVD